MPGKKDVGIILVQNMLPFFRMRLQVVAQAVHGDLLLPHLAPVHEVAANTGIGMTVFGGKTQGPDFLVILAED